MGAGNPHSVAALHILLNGAGFSSSGLQNQTRRAGETLFFGNTAAAVLERCDTAILFVAS